MLSPARDGYATVLTYWEALAGERMSRHFSLLPFVSCFPDFYLIIEHARIGIAVRLHVTQKQCVTMSIIWIL